MYKKIIFLLCIILCIVVVPSSTFAAVHGWQSIPISFDVIHDSQFSPVEMEYTNHGVFNSTGTNVDPYITKFCSATFQVPITFQAFSLPTDDGWLIGDFNFTFSVDSEFTGVDSADWKMISPPSVSLIPNNVGGATNAYSRISENPGAANAWNLQTTLGPQRFRSGSNYYFSAILEVKVMWYTSKVSSYVANNHPILKINKINSGADMSFTDNVTLATDYGFLLDRIYKNVDSINSEIKVTNQMLLDYFNQSGDTSGVDQGNQSFEEENSSFQENEGLLMEDAADSIDKVDFNTTSLLSSYAVSTKFFLDVLDGHIDNAGGFWLVVVFGFMLSFVFYILRLRR